MDLRFSRLNTEALLQQDPIDVEAIVPQILSSVHRRRLARGHHLRQRNQLMARRGRGALRRVLNGAINASLVSPNMQARFDGLAGC